MSLLSKLFTRRTAGNQSPSEPSTPHGQPLREPTMLDRIDAVAHMAIVDGYRRISRERGCAPTAKTSDAEIIETYRLVGTGFREVSEQRGEQLRALNLNHIVLSFLQLREMMPEMLERHLVHELKKYRREGLRSDYLQDLTLL